MPFLQSNTGYDPVRDFSPITLVTSAPNVLVVHPATPAHTVRELIALAKARPGTLNFSSSPAGGTSHLAGELFKAMAGIDIVWVPYKGAGPALVALVGGEVQVMFGNPLAVAPHLKANRLRALAVTTPEPSALAPGLPTVASSGLPGYESRAMQGIWAPAKTPAAVVQRLNQEVLRALSVPEIRQKILDSGAEPAGSSPEEFAELIKSDMARMGKVIKNAGIHVE
jgi:tripartite-type tricarboxylate transporter receptor subunit TctC